MCASREKPDFLGYWLFEMFTFDGLASLGSGVSIVSMFQCFRSFNVSDGLPSVSSLRSVQEFQGVLISSSWFQVPGFKLLLQNSRIKRPTSTITHPKSDIFILTSEIRHPTSYIRHPTFPIRNPKSTIPNPTSDIHHSQSAIRNLQSPIQHPTSDIRHPQSDIRHPTSNIPNPFTFRSVSGCLEL